jgi:hypothetical protein
LFVPWRSACPESMQCDAQRANERFSNQIEIHLEALAAHL